MKGNLYGNFLGKTVNVGIPNFVRKDRLFFVTGVVLDISDNFLTLKIKDGVRKIPINDVREISINQEEDMNETY